MKLPRRPVLLALLALAAPLPALAVSGDDAPAGPTDLAVSTSLGSCGITDSQMVCQLNVSYNALENATSYTASVTRADGSVVDYGSVPAGGTSLWVPYVGAGSYSVTVTAYGSPEEPGEPKEEIATDVSGAEGAGAAEGKVETDGKATAEVEGQAAEPAEGDGDGAGAPEAPGDAVAGEACTEQAPPAPPIPPEPVEPQADTDPANPDEAADGLPDAEEAAEYERLKAEREEAIAAAEAAELPDSIDC
jgi:hypothetical protein